ncbi:LutB/LldF family L-lactate oxidation iron-sulfur protein [Gynuella sunshinyii]|uniref:Putative conserved protein containing a ferredoxin-like domain n=1 Tax=Gynuella sunshinyii YC6258 TaxID=1445510 RepID=A0A0C5VN65_9GAMM|nr:LutB/LldF family L-lactate oxidation iron-sulfur protein [Gynuella sunshinyii]AJQ96157.1 putative conserved protein containing a ferredoxin-like domain [Gynuella sunshinyii YC6258]
MSQPRHTSVEHWRSGVQDALNNPVLQSGLAGAMDYLQEKRRLQFPDQAVFEQRRQQASAIKKSALSRLPELLEQLESRCQANGIQVHWAETGQQASAIALDICRQQKATSVVKGKSMVSEEIHLNDVLIAAGMSCLESDMGEYIVQLAGETPSHIIMPAIHKTKQEIARLFADKIPGIQYTEDVDELIRIGRRVLRHAFETADIGVSGVNFAVAETGTLCLVENEGNGRMSTTMPKVHIAFMGIEKVVASLNDLPPLLHVLTRSATGQNISTYVNMISGPRRGTDLDGPEQVHLILLDNGRSQAYADEQQRQTLQCIRCGACMNHCPVYRRVGGHTYDTTYPGPIGKILMPHLQGLMHTAHLPTASTLCGACGDVCPVKIPIPELLQRWRYQASEVTPSNAKKREKFIWAFWRFANVHPKLYRLGLHMFSRIHPLLPDNLGPWTWKRRKPAFSKQTLHQQMRKRRSHS